MTRDFSEDFSTALTVIKTSLHLIETKIATAEEVLKLKYPEVHTEYQTALDKALLGPLSVHAKILEDVQRRRKE